MTADMKIVKEEIFGPVGVVIKFEDEAGMPGLSLSLLVLDGKLNNFQI